MVALVGCLQHLVVGDQFSGLRYTQLYLQCRIFGNTPPITMFLVSNVMCKVHFQLLCGAPEWVGSILHFQAHVWGQFGAEVGAGQ